MYVATNMFPQVLKFQIPSEKEKVSLSNTRLPQLLNIHMECVCKMSQIQMIYFGPKVINNFANFQCHSYIML